jgi:hypothetical protein
MFSIIFGTTLSFLGDYHKWHSVFTFDCSLLSLFRLTLSSQLTTMNNLPLNNLPPPLTAGVQSQFVTPPPGTAIRPAASLPASSIVRHPPEEGMNTVNVPRPNLPTMTKLWRDPNSTGRNRLLEALLNAVLLKKPHLIPTDQSGKSNPGWEKLTGIVCDPISGCLRGYTMCLPHKRSPFKL